MDGVRRWLAGIDIRNLSCTWLSVYLWMVFIYWIRLPICETTELSFCEGKKKPESNRIYRHNSFRVLSGRQERVFGQSHSSCAHCKKLHPFSSCYAEPNSVIEKLSDFKIKFSLPFIARMANFHIQIIPHSVVSGVSDVRLHMITFHMYVYATCSKAFLLMTENVRNTEIDKFTGREHTQ